MSLQPNARISALGGYGIAIRENDVNLAAQNPSLLQKDMDNQIGYNHVFYFDGIGAGHVGYAKHFDSIGTFSAGLQYIYYGTFQHTSPSGEHLGEFTAGEYSFQAAYAKKLDDKFTVGGQMKFIYSSLESYTSLGLAADLAGTYYDEENLLTLTVVASNFGTQLKSYRQNNRENLPLNLQVGIAKKFPHAPFRFALTAHNLQTPRLLYNNLSKPGLQKNLETGAPMPEDFNVFDHVLSHLNLSGELLLGKNVYVGVGYNHLRRWEMRLADAGGLTGFAWGFGLKLSKFQLAYGSSSYHIGRATNHVSFIIYMNEYLKKK